MPYLIATDEAGYGPKLGPLVIVATAWTYTAGSLPKEPFLSLSEPFEDSRCGTLHIDDSKRVFRRKLDCPPGRLPILDEICRGASRWALIPDPLDQFFEWLQAVAKSDCKAIEEDPCLTDFSKHATVTPTEDNVAADRELIAHWSTTGASLKAIQARLITPAIFNSIVDAGMNKADLLTELTCQLAFDLIRTKASTETSVIVKSDRHGGRAFYGAALQHVCESTNLRVVKEGKPISQYELTRTTESGIDQTIDWSFTIGGDSFAPVALSSIIAKWLRERSMASLNRYFVERMPIGKTLLPTAGYPTDADRFLQDITRAGLRASIPDSVLIRKR